LSLISPAEDKANAQIAEAVQVSFAKVLLDGRLMTSAQERTNLASRIVAAADVEQKCQSSNRWFLEKAKEADLELDDNLLEDDDSRPQQEMNQLQEARKAKVQLAQLLGEQMKTQRFGKFLSTNTAATQKGSVTPLIPSTAQPPRKGRKKQK
jgi:hypothetical protein